VSTYNYAENIPTTAIDLHGLQAIFIHGTWGDDSHWSSPAQRLVTDATGNKQTVDYEWSGNNNQTARLLAASSLAEKARDLYLESGEVLTLVGHSHGGNVAIEAANILYYDYGIKVDNLITVNTPATEEVQVRGELGDVLKTEKRHINFFTSNDLIQTFGDNEFSRDNKETITELQDYGKTRGGEVGLAGRKFSSAINVKYQDQIPLFNKSGCGFSNHCGTAFSNVKVWSKKLQEIVYKRPN
jgi:pimeloyl-ACP methyl ester carboxylesterase